MSPLPRPATGAPRWLGTRLVVALVAGAAVLLGLGAWANALAEPVIRPGVPTGSVTPPPPKPTPAATSPTAQVSPSALPSESAKPSEEPTATQSEKPAKPADTSFATSTATQSPVSSLGTRHTFVVKVETSTGLDANKVAKEVAGVLNDPRSWTGSGDVRFALVKDPAKADFTVYVSAPKRVDAKCSTDAWVCVRGSKVVLSAKGWGTPAPTYAGDAAGFRRYLVNNAVGSYLGERKASCAKAGKPAPVMAAQADDLHGCLRNPWPYS